MRWMLVFLLLFIPQIALAEMVFLRILDVDGLQLVTASEAYTLGEECVIKNRDEKPLALSEIHLPATAKGDAELIEDRLVLKWLVVTDDNNNRIVPE